MFPPNRQTLYGLKQGMVGAPVWSLQKALNDNGASLSVDGQFGNKTEQAVRMFQGARKLTVDGICGGATQTVLVILFVAKATTDKLLRKLAEAQVFGESGGYLGAVNWLVKGGVDCCTAQRRVYATSWQEPWPDYGAQFKADDLERAFDSRYQIKLLVNRLKERHDTFLKRPAVSSDQRAWRLAVYAHNNPAGSDHLSKVKEKDLSPYWWTPQKWVTNIGAHFPDGAKVSTPMDWARHYSLGDPTHNEPGFMVRGIWE